MILRILKSHCDHIDADIVDNLENDILLNLKTDEKDEENIDDINNGKKN